MYLVRKLSYPMRYILEMLSVPFDLLCAGVYLAKSAILNSTRLDCEGLVKEKCTLLWSVEHTAGFPHRTQRDRPVNTSAVFCEPSRSLSWLTPFFSAVFQSGASRESLKAGFVVDDVDQQCAASMFIYWLCHIAM